MIYDSCLPLSHLRRRVTATAGHRTKTAITTKSSAAVRVVPLPRVLRTLLAAHLELVDDARRAAFVVPSRAGRPFDPSTVYKRADAA